MRKKDNDNSSGSKDCLSQSKECLHEWVGGTVVSFLKMVSAMVAAIVKSNIYV